MARRDGSAALRHLLERATERRRRGGLQGTAAGTAGPVTLWHQDSPGIKGKAETGDLFGSLG